MKTQYNRLKSQYGKWLRYALIFSLVFHITVLIAIPRYHSMNTEPPKPETPPIETVDVPQTDQYRKPPEPKQPSVPIPSQREDLPADQTIEPTELDDFTALDAPPEQPAPPKHIFVEYDEKPELIGGYASLIRNLTYPEIARAAGIEGTVFVKFYINKDGEVTRAEVLKGLPKTGLNEAAINAVLKTRWKPAMQRDQAVGVWYSIPVRFTLKAKG